MTTSLLNRYQIDRNLRRSTEHVEIVPQETCVHHESPDSVLTECATTTSISQTPKMVSTRRASEQPGDKGEQYLKAHNK